VANKEEKLKNLDSKVLEDLLVFQNDNWLVFNKPA
jgi:hypothetical protein